MMNMFYQYLRHKPYCQFELGCFDKLYYISVSLIRELHDINSRPIIYFDIRRDLIEPTLKRYMDTCHHQVDKISNFISRWDGFTFEYDDHSSLRIFNTGGLFI